MLTKFAKLVLSVVCSAVLATALSLSAPALASTGNVHGTASASGKATRVYAGDDDKKGDEKKAKDEKKKGGDKKDKAPSGGW